MKNRGIGWLGLFFLLVWGLPVLACGGSVEGTATPTKAPVVNIQEATQAATDTPTPELTTGPSPDVLRYASEAKGPVDQISKSLARLGELFQTPQVGVDDWTYAVAAELVLIQLAHETLVNIDAPPEMTGVHTELVAGTSLCYEATELIVSALDNLDADEMSRASAKITECGNGFTTALELANVYMSGIGGQDTAPQATVNNEANLRGGPGTDFAVVGSLTAGQAIEVAGRNEAGDWFQLKGGEWIAAFLVDGAPGGLPVVGR